MVVAAAVERVNKEYHHRCIEVDINYLADHNSNYNSVLCAVTGNHAGFHTVGGDLEFSLQPLLSNLCMCRMDDLALGTGSNFLGEYAPDLSGSKPTITYFTTSMLSY